MFAFGAKRTCRDRRRRINPTLMTLAVWKRLVCEILAI
jgi:hypothetical protein